MLGDLDGDGTAGANDAADLLIAAAVIGAGGASPLTEEQAAAADVNGDGKTNATDSAIILIYAAAIGAGEDAKLLTAVEADDTLEAFAYFLADTDGESRDHGATTGITGTTGASPLNATDAANVLIYSAIVGAQGTADWIDELDDQDGVLSTPYPAYSEKIATTAGLIK